MLKTTTSTKDCIFPVLSNDCRAHRNVACENGNLAAPAHTLFSSPSLPLQGPDIVNQVGTTALSSGYGTLSAWGTCLETAGSPREDEDGSPKHHWHPDKQKNAETTVKICQQDDSTERTLRVEESNLLDNQSTSRYETQHTSQSQSLENFKKLCFTNVPVEKRYYIVIPWLPLLIEPNKLWLPGPRGRNSWLRRAKLNKHHLKTLSTKENKAAKENL